MQNMINGKSIKEVWKGLYVLMDDRSTGRFLKISSGCNIELKNSLIQSWVDKRGRRAISTCWNSYTLKYSFEFLLQDLTEHTWLWWDEAQLNQSIAMFCDVIQQSFSTGQIVCWPNCCSSTSVPVNSTWIRRASKCRKHDWHQAPTYVFFKWSGSTLTWQTDASYDVCPKREFQIEILPITMFLVD